MEVLHLLQRLSKIHNFRVVGYGDKDYLAELENNDNTQNVGANTAVRNANKLKIVNKQVTGTPEEREIQRSTNYVSNVLLVWRFLHAELDSYAAPGGGVVFNGACVGDDDVNPGNLVNSDLSLMLTEYRRAFVETVNDLGVVDATDETAFVRNLADAAAAAHSSALDYLGDVPWDQHAAAKDWYVRIKSRPSFRPLLDDRIPGLPPPKHYADLDF